MRWCVVKRTLILEHRELDSSAQSATPSWATLGETLSPGLCGCWGPFGFWHPMTEGQVVMIVRL